MIPDYKAKTDIKNLTTAELASWLENQNIRRYRAKQVFKWIYTRREDGFENMTDLGLDLRNRLASRFSIDRLEATQIETSNDGSVKYLFRLNDGHRIESVLIPESKRNTLCISSQVGCGFGCRFCLTGKTGYIRNLTMGEIISQVRDISHKIGAQRNLTHIVLMGMGEPLANYINVIRAIGVLTDKNTGLGFSNRRITISTAGVASLIPNLASDTAVNLAVSLNETDNRMRSRLMPINRTYPIETLLKSCRQYVSVCGRKITFEYVLIKGINDLPENARRLAEMLRSVPCKINLIPFNPHEGCDYQTPDTERIEAFKEILANETYTVMVRRSRGRDISAACGQLRGLSIRETVSRQANGEFPTAALP